MKPCQLVSIISRDGHHREYAKALLAILPGALAPSQRSSRDIVTAFARRRSLLFMSIETHPLAFVFSALLGFILRVPVAGLLFRPLEALDNIGWKHRIKNRLLRGLRYLPNTAVLTILPYAVEPRFATVAVGWIYDIQLWDLAVLAAGSPGGLPPLSSRIREAAAGRRVIAAIGAQNYRKGFPYLGQLWMENAALRERFLVVAAGKVEDECGASAEAFVAAGGMLVDRRIDDDEMFALYRGADLIWACYPPTFNLASGIFGRAFQLGVPVIVRDGSFAAELGRAVGHPSLELPFDAAEAAGQRIVEWVPPAIDAARTRVEMQAMMDWTCQVLDDVLAGRRPATKRQDP